jgi:hypothetical protein
MSKSRLINTDRSNPDIYEIRIQGHLHKKRERLFEGLTIIRCDDGSTVLVGPLPDQTALRSILLQICNMNLKLISVGQVSRDLEEDQEALWDKKEVDLEIGLDRNFDNDKENM